jgi:hypothetical protein
MFIGSFVFSRTTANHNRSSHRKQGDFARFGAEDQQWRKNTWLIERIASRMIHPAF